jgi:hypothetical protein
MSSRQAGALICIIGGCLIPAVVLGGDVRNVNLDRGPGGLHLEQEAVNMLLAPNVRVPQSAINDGFVHAGWNGIPAEFSISFPRIENASIGSALISRRQVSRSLLNFAERLKFYRDFKQGRRRFAVVAYFQPIKLGVPSLAADGPMAER